MSTVKLSDFPETLQKSFVNYHEIDNEVVDNKIIENFEKGLISEELFNDCLDILEKANGSHRYIRREGSPGNYRYIYKENEGKKGSSKKVDESVQGGIDLYREASKKVAEEKGKKSDISKIRFSMSDGENFLDMQDDIEGAGFKEGEDYKLVYGRGDDTPNAIVSNNEKFEKWLGDQGFKLDSKRKY